MAKRVIDYAVGAVTNLTDARDTCFDRSDLAAKNLAQGVAVELHGRIRENMTTAPEEHPYNPDMAETNYRIDLLVFTPEELSEHVTTQCVAYHKAHMRSIVNMLREVAKV